MNVNNTEKSLEKRKNIARKITALLNKTVENGATEHESLSALNKAREMMMEYHLTENDLIEEKEKITYITIDRIQSGYSIVGFLYWLSELFNCEHYYTKKEMTFVGHEIDLELITYFYEYISHAILNGAKEYRRSSDYLESRKYHPGRTLVASYIQGFIYRINYRIKEMIPPADSQYGIILVDRKTKVKDFYEDMGVDVKGSNYTPSRLIVGAMITGSEEAINVNLNAPIKAGQRTLRLAESNN